MTTPLTSKLRLRHKIMIAQCTIQSILHHFFQSLKA